VYADRTGYEHIVFILGNSVCVKYGNGFRRVGTLGGTSYDGLYYPQMFVHEGKLIIINDGFKPVVFDGFDDCQPVGVTETPLAPTCYAMRIPGSMMRMKDSVFLWTHLWWPQDRPDSWPAKAKRTEIDGELTNIDGSYSVVVQYVDKYGNRGPCSSPSAPCYVEHEEQKTEPDRWVAKYLISQWEVPLVDSHVVGVIVGRSGNMHADDDNNMTTDAFYAEYSQIGTAPCRFVHQHSDIVLKSFGEVDRSVGPPGASYCGASWKGRLIVVSSEDRTIVKASAIGSFGEFSGVTYRAGAPVAAIVPMGDRLAIVTRDAIEILYEIDIDGSPRLARLETVPGRGSVWGRSLASLGVSIVGLFNEGFGMYSAESGFSKIPCPYWASGDFVDDDVRMMASIVNGDFYMFSCRIDGYGDDTNTVLLLHLTTGKWYLVREQVNDMTSASNDLVLAATNDSIYELFRGESPAAALHIDNWVPQGTGMDSTLSVGNIRVMMKPSSSLVSVVGLSSIFDDAESQGSMPMIPNVSSVSGPSYQVWDSETEYGEHAWRDKDSYVKINHDRVLTTSSLSIFATIPPGHYASIAAISIEYNQGKSPEGSR
jgi:hypothetical protein